jgi:hypothetical protein
MSSAPLDLAGLIATNANNTATAAAMRAPGGGLVPIRVVGVDRSELREALDLDGSPRVDLTRHSWEVSWHYLDMPLAVHAGPETAIRLVAMYRRFTVDRLLFRPVACVVWIGDQRYWVSWPDGADVSSESMPGWTATHLPPRAGVL